MSKETILPFSGGLARHKTYAITVTIAVACILVGYAAGTGALTQKTLLQTTNVYATSFNNEGISSFPYFPTISQAGTSSALPPYVDGSGTSNTLVPSITVSVTTTQANDVIVVEIETDLQTVGFTSASTFTGTWNLNWILESSLEYSTNGAEEPYWIYLFYASAGANVGTDTITVGFPSPYTVNAAGGAAIIAFAVKNVAATIWDGTPAQSAQNAHLNAGATGITTTNAHDLVISFLGVAADVAITKSATFTTIATQATADAASIAYSEYRSVAAAGTYTSTPTFGPPRQYCGMIVGAIEGTTVSPSLDGAGTSSATFVNSITTTVTTSQSNDAMLLLLETDTQTTGFTTAADVSSGFGLVWTFETDLEYSTAGGQAPYWMYVFYAPTGASVGTESLTVEFPAPYTVAAATMTGVGVANVAASPWDGALVKTGAGLTGSAGSLGITTGDPDDLVFSMVGITNAPLTVTTTPSFSEIASLSSGDNHFTGYSEYQRVVAANTYSSAPSWGNNQGYGMIMGALTSPGPIFSSAPYIDGEASSTATGNNPASLSVSVTTSQPNDLMILLLSTEKQATAQTAASITDTFGLTWALETAALEFITAGGPSPAWLYLFYAPSGVHLGTDTITASFAANAAGNAAEIAIGLANVASSPWDGAPVTTTGTSTSATLGITTTHTNDFVFSFLGVDTTQTITKTTTFSKIATQAAQSGDYTSYAEDAREAATGTFTSSPSWTASEPYGMIGAAVIGGSVFHPPGAANVQPCTTTLTLPGGSGAQSPNPAFLNATGAGTTCFNSNLQYMFLEWQLTANQTTKSIPAGNYYLNFSFTWYPFNSAVLHSWGVSLPLVVSATQTNGPTITIYLMFGTLPVGPALGTILPVITEVAATLAL